MKSRFLVTLSLACAASACVMPRSVTSLGEVHSASEEGRIKLVELTPSTIPASPSPHATFPAAFFQAEAIDRELIGPGDVLNVHIWEGGTPTIFTGSSGDLGEVTVDDRGRLFVPFVGPITAAGRTPAELRAEVTARLRTVVRSPQVDLRPVRVRSRLVSVQGNASKAGSYPIERGRTRLGELLGEAAPDLKNPEMLEVTVRRGDQIGTVRMADILRNPQLDIALLPGDAIVLNEIVEHVTVLGATGTQGQVRIAERDYSVVDVLGEARGLDENSADPRAVFLLRFQPGDTQPTIYRLEMRRPETLALASRFIVQDKDTLLVSNAPFAQTRKILSALTQTLSTARTAVLAVP